MKTNKNTIIKVQFSTDELQDILRQHVEESTETKNLSITDFEYWSHNNTAKMTLRPRDEVEAEEIAEREEREAADARMAATNPTISPATAEADDQF